MMSEGNVSDSSLTNNTDHMKYNDKHNRQGYEAMRNAGRGGNVIYRRLVFRSLTAGLLLLAGGLFLPSSCKKADQYAQLVNNQPYLITGQVGLVNIGLGVYPGYQTSYLVGDTAILIGRFFLDRPGSQIRVGNDIAHIAFRTQVAKMPDSVNQYTGKTDELDYIKFAITASMGLGDHIPVTISANGVTIRLRLYPSLSTRVLSGGQTPRCMWTVSVPGQRLIFLISRQTTCLPSIIPVFPEMEFSVSII